MNLRLSLWNALARMALEFLEIAVQAELFEPWILIEEFINVIGEYRGYLKQLSLEADPKQRHFGLFNRQ